MPTLQIENGFNISNMSIINSNNFVFIHIYKCGGMSMRKVIQENLNSVEIGMSHYTAKEMKDFCYSNGGHFFWKTAFKFSFVRNPFDWVVSLYEFIKANETHPNHDETKNMNFEQFCIWNVNSIKNKKNNFNGNFNTLTEFLFEDKDLLVDYVGKIENYNEDANAIFKRLGIPQNKVPLINENKNRDKNYRNYYTDKSIQIITDAFYYDLVNFNYQF